MKPRPFLSLLRTSSKTFPAMAFCLVATLATAPAASLYWDATPGTPDGASNGGLGIWDTATANWDDGDSYELWNNGGNDTAVFAGTAGTVTIDTIDDLGVTVGGLTFNTANYIIGGDPLTFGAAGDIQNNGTATINAVVAGSVGLSKSGNGTLFLKGDNTYTGDTVISGGTLKIGDNTASSLGGGTYAGNISIASGAQFFLKTTTAHTLSGIISGDGNFRTGGSGQIALTDDNTYTGQTLIQPENAASPTLVASSINSVTTDGELGTVASPSSSLGAPTTAVNGTIQIGGSSQRSARLIYTGSGETTDRIIKLATNGNSATTANTIENAGSGLLKFVSPFELVTGGMQGFELAGDGDGEIVEALPSTDSFFKKSGDGTWTLGSDANRFGRQIQFVGDGVLSVSHIGDGGFARSVTTSNGNPVVTVDDTTGLAVGMTIATQNIPDGRTIASITPGAPGTITLDSGSGVGGGGGSTRNAAIGFPAGLGISTSEPGGIIWTNGSSATLQYTGPNHSSNRGFTIDNGDTATWDVASAVLTVSGDSAATSGKIAKTGAGTLVLSGTLRHTGTPNAVSEGTLMIHGDASAMTGAVEVAALATFGGSGTIGGDLTVADTGKLTFDLSTAPGGHDKLDVTGALTLPIGPETSELTITSAGGATTGNYTLLTATGAISGDVPVTVNLPGGWTADAPQIVGNDLQINITSTGGGGTTYASWSGAAAANDDTNGDGVRNAVAYALGAADVSENAIGLLPELDNTTDPDFFIFSFNRSDDAEADSTTAISVEYGSDLSDWTTAVAGPDVVITETPGSPTDAVEVKIRRTLAVGNKLFARLQVIVTP